VHEREGKGISTMQLTTNERVEYAGFLNRLFADVCDSAVVLVLSLLVYYGLDRWLLGPDTGPFGEAIGVGDFVALAWFFWNLTYLVGKTGQSWGRKFGDVSVVGSRGEPIGFWRALLRNLFAAFISGPLFGLGFLWVIWDPAKQAWHDKVFGTYVVKTGRH
jgi:uncharacterized RDD family membrane protein YckC